MRYLRAGSSGVLPKPTKLQDLTDMVASQLTVFLGKGVVSTDPRGFVVTSDGAFAFSKIRPSCTDPDEAEPAFVPSMRFGAPVGAERMAVAAAAAEAEAAEGARGAASQNRVGAVAAAGVGVPRGGSLFSTSFASEATAPQETPPAAAPPAGHEHSVPGGAAVMSDL